MIFPKKQYNYREKDLFSLNCNLWSGSRISTERQYGFVSVIVALETIDFDTEKGIPQYGGTNLSDIRSTTL